MSNTVKIVFFSDAGHGWGRVLRNQINELRIADQISEYSYQYEGHVYLEEDRDLPLFIAALHAAGFDKDVIYQEPVERSRIRRLQRYQFV